MNKTVEPGDILTAERIAQMRDAVMAEISQEATAAPPRPTARPRRLSPALIAAAAVVTAGSIGVGILDTRPGAAGNDSFISQTSSGATRDSATPEQGLASVEDVPADGSATDQESSAENTLDIRAVITRGHISLTVPVLSAAVTQIERLVTDLGGRIDSRSVSGGDEPAGTIQPSPPDGSRGWGSVVVRIPPKHVGEFTEELRGLGTVESVSIDKSDVTSQTTDLGARIKSLQVSVDRLTEIMAEADNATELLAAETQLSQRQAELESLQAQRRTLGSQVELASITVELQPDSEVASIEPEGFTGGLEKGWDALVSTANAALVGFGILLPWLLPLVVLGVVARLIWRRVRS